MGFEIITPLRRSMLCVFVYFDNNHPFGGINSPFGGINSPFGGINLGFGGTNFSFGGIKMGFWWY